jgi:hypothetical protein
MENKELYQELIEQVIDQIEEDLDNGIPEAIEELLRLCPTNTLISFLSEDYHEKFKQLKD